jgi:hypothetical protein
MANTPPLHHKAKPTSLIYRIAGERQVLRTDGTWGVPTGPILTLRQDHSSAVDDGRAIDGELACKLAVAEVLLGTVARDVPWREIMEQRAEQLPKPPSMRFEAKTLSLDWPDHEEDEQPSLAATIRPTDAGFTYDSLGLSGPDLLEETFGVFAPGTVLVHERDLRGTVVVEMNCASRTIRDGVRMALMTAFEREPSDFRGGRRIVVRPYYDRDVRITLADQPFSTPDDGGDAHAKRFPLLCFLECEVEGVRLVPTEPRFEVPPVPRLYVAFE